MKNHRFLWLRNRTTDNRKCEKARNIKEKRTIEMFSTASKQLAALPSSPSAEFIPCFLQRLLLRQEPLFFVPVGRRATWGPPYGDPASRCRAGPMCPAVSCRPPCHSEPVTDVTGVGIRNPLTVRWMPRWMLRRHSRRDRRLKTCRWHVFLTPRRIATPV